MPTRQKYSFRLSNSTDECIGSSKQLLRQKQTKPTQTNDCRNERCGMKYPNPIPVPIAIPITIPIAIPIAIAIA